MRTAIVAAALVCASAVTAHAGGGIIIPPVELDAGMGAPVGGGTAVTGPTTEVLAGLHWASLAWRPTRFDLGVGYVGSSRDVLPGYAARIAEGSTASAAGNELRLDGGYLELGKTLAGSTRHWRSWIMARGELLHGSVGDRSFSALGEAVRVSTEIYTSGVLSAPNGGVCGTFAIGVYVEAAHRELSPELGPNSVTSGITVRLPFLGAG